MPKLCNHNIILPKYFEVVKQKGSSFVPPASGVAGQGRLNTKDNFPPKKIWAKPKQTGKNWGSLRGKIFACLPKQSPAFLLVQSRGQQKSFLFLLEEKTGRAQNKKLRRKLFCGTASEASGGGAKRQSSQSGFSSKNVRILTKRYRQFSEFGFWAIVASPSLRSGSAETMILYGFLKSQNNFCPLKRKFGLPKTNINLKNLLTNLFSFAEGERQNDNLILTAQ